MSKGRLIWITGLSGSGKTTISKELYEILKKSNQVIHLDGDSMREILGNFSGYTLEERKNNAKIYCRLCKFLIDQGFDVIMSTISLFHEIHEFNRTSIENYYEVFLDASIELLKNRNQKGLYENPNKVVGMDLKPEYPKDPHLVLKDEELNDLKLSIPAILSLIEKKEV